MATIEKPHRITEDAPLHDGSDRYRIYYLKQFAAKRVQVQIADTSLEGIGPCLSVLRNEGQITSDDRVGIRDRVEHVWLINPYAVGR